MAGTITTGNHPKLMWPGLFGLWGRTYNEHPLEGLDLFDQENSTQNYEEVVEVTGFGVAPVKKEGAGVAFDSETQGTVSRFTNVSIALGFIVTKEELDDNLYEPKGRPRAVANAFSMRQTKEILAANTFLNNGFDNAFAGGDGVALYSADHPTRTGLQSNLLAGADLSETAIEDALIQIMLMTNSRGLKINLIGQSLHVHPNDFFEAHRIMKSVLQNDTANNAVNAIKVSGMLPKGIKVNHYFTDTDAWAIRTNAPRGMIQFNRQKAVLRDNDFNTGNAKAKSWERYIHGWGDFRAAVGNPGV